MARNATSAQSILEQGGEERVRADGEEGGRGYLEDERLDDWVVLQLELLDKHRDAAAIDAVSSAFLLVREHHERCVHLPQLWRCEQPLRSGIGWDHPHSVESYLNAWERGDVEDRTEAAQWLAD
jgi:hypothetical protein